MKEKLREVLLYTKVALAVGIALYAVAAEATEEIKKLVKDV